MSGYERQRLLVRVAKLYYEEGYGQEKIADLLNLSRPYVSRLLRAAREEGIVRIQVVDPFNMETPLEREFRERFGLKKAVIIPGEKDRDPLKRVGEAVARYLDEVLQDGDVIGTSWGGTIRACSEALIPRTDRKGLISVQLCGGVSDTSQTVYASEIAGNFSANLGTKAYLVPTPAVVDSRTVRDLLRKDRSIEQAMHYWKEAQIALFTAGAFGPHSALVRAGYLKEEEMERLTEKGAVGDVCSHVIDRNGEICDADLDERTMAIPLAELKRKRIRIGAAQGFSKVDSLCGLLRGGILNVLVTDEVTAKSVLERLGE